MRNCQTETRNRATWHTLALAAASSLAACAPVDQIERPSVPPAALRMPVATPAAPGRPALLSATLVSGARIATGIDRSGTLLAAGGAGYQPLVHPVSASGYGQSLYIADIGSGNLYRYDSAQNAMIAHAGLRAQAGMRVRVGGDYSLYVLDASARRVQQHSRSGQLVATYGDDVNLGRAVDFALDTARGRVLVADAMYNHLIAYHPLGRASYILPLRSDRGERVLGIAGIAIGGDTIYLSDPLCHCIVRVTPEGAIAGRFGTRELSQPGALAVDREARVYVVDAYNRTLKVFFADRLLATLRSEELGLQEISDLSVQDDWITLTDGAGARVQVMRIASDKAAQER